MHVHMDMDSSEVNKDEELPTPANGITLLDDAAPEKARHTEEQGGVNANEKRTSPSIAANDFFRIQFCLYPNIF